MVYVVPSWSIDILVAEVFPGSIDGTVLGLSSLSSFVAFKHGANECLSVARTWDTCVMDALWPTLQAAKQAKQWATAVHLLGQMEAQQRRPNVVIYSTVINACEKAARWTQALSLLTAAESKTVEIDVILCTATMGSCEKASAWQAALSLFDSLEGRCLQPDIRSYGVALRACQTSHQWEKALLLLRRAKDKTLQLNLIVFNSAISACGGAAQWQNAMRLLKSMASMEVTADSISYNAAMAACSSLWQQALLLFQSMDDLAIIKDSFTFSTAIIACGRAKQWLASTALLRDACDRGMVNIVTLNAAMEAVMRWEESLALIQMASELAMEVDPGAGSLEEAGLGLQRPKFVWTGFAETTKQVSTLCCPPGPAEGKAGVSYKRLSGCLEGRFDLSPILDFGSLDRFMTSETPLAVAAVQRLLQRKGGLLEPLKSPYEYYARAALLQVQARRAGEEPGPSATIAGERFQLLQEACVALQDCMAAPGFCANNLYSIEGADGKRGDRSAMARSMAKDPRVWYLLGLLLCDLGSFEEARKAAGLGVIPGPLGG
eukprot:s771_g4.t1